MPSLLKVQSVDSVRPVASQSQKEQSFVHCVVWAVSQVCRAGQTVRPVLAEHMLPRPVLRTALNVCQDVGLARVKTPARFAQVVNSRRLPEQTIPAL